VKISEVRARLDPFPEHLPEIPAQIIPYVIDAQGTPVPREPRFDGSRRAAAVLILIYPDADGEAQIILTERAAGGHRHAGQISPSRRRDRPGRRRLRKPRRCARRARRSGSIRSRQACVSSCVLPVFDVRVSGFLVHPVVAFADIEPALHADEYEVVDVFSAPLAAFLPGAPIETVTAERDGFRLRYGGYQIGRHHVWGATAMMLGRFGAYLASADREDMAART